MSTMNKTNRASIITIFFLAIIPLISSEALNEYYLLPRTVAWSVFASIGLAFGFFKLTQKEKFEWSWPLWLWLGFTLTSTLSLGHIFSMPEWWLTFSRYLLYSSVLLGSVHLYRKDMLTYDTFSQGMVIFSLIGGAIALKNAVNTEDVYAAFAPFGHKNFTAAALLIGLLASLRTAQSKHPVWSKLAIAAILLCTIDIILLRTRGVWIAAVLSSIALLIGSRLLRPSGSIASVIPVKYIGVGFIVLLGGIIAFSSRPDVKDAVLETANIELRFKYWNSSIDMMSEQPLTGIGSGQWKFNFAKHGLEGTNTRVANGETGIMRPHNDYFWVLSENGVLGGLLYISFWLAMLWLSVRKLRITEDTDERMRLLSAFAIVVAFMSYAMGEFPIERVDIAIPAFLAAGFVISRFSGIPFHAKPILGIALALSVFTLYKSYNRMTAERDVKVINEGNDQRNPNKILSTYDKIDLAVVDVDIVGNPLPYFKGLALMATAGGQNGQINQARMNDAKAHFDQALEINPWHVNTINQYGNWHKNQNQIDEAVAMYEKGLEISPYNTDLRLNRAEMYLRQNNPDGAALMLYNLKQIGNNPKYNTLVVQSLKRLKNGSKHEAIQRFIDSIDFNNINDSQLVGAFNRYKDNAL